MNDSSSHSAVVARLRALAADRRPGDRLPTTRAVVAELSVSPVTVNNALAQLAAEGIVVTEPGRGTFVAPRPRQSTPDIGWQTVALGPTRIDDSGLARLLALPDPTATVLSSGYLADDLQPTRALIAATGRAARRPGAWGRVPPAGLPELRVALATIPGVDAADVLVVPGAQAGLSAALRALAAPGEPVLVEVPTYVGAIAAARSAGLRLVPVPTDDHGLRPDLLEAAFARTGARLLYTQPTYANPSGTVLAHDRRAAVLDTVRAAGAFLIEDDWARHLGTDGTVPPPLIRDDTHGHVVYLASLTKPAAPSLRVGALVARGPAAARLAALRMVDDMFVSRPLQEIAVELLHSPAWTRHLLALRAALRTRRDALAAAVRTHLPQCTITRLPSGGLHLWVRLPDTCNDIEIAARARRADVLVEPGAPYFITEPPAPHLRLTYAAAHPDQLHQGVRSLAALIP